MSKEMREQINKVKNFGQFLNENFTKGHIPYSITLPITKCKWCDKKFKPSKKGQSCCTPEHDSKYNNSLANDNSEKPWDKYTNDNYKDNYYN